MTLSDLASVGSLISGLAVLISLIYLSIQTRQNTKHTRALIFQGGTEIAMEQFHAMADADLAAAMIIGNGGQATPEQIKAHQFTLLCVLTSVCWENLFVQHEEGLLDEGHFRRIRRGLTQLLRGNPGVRGHFKAMISIPGAPGDKFHDFLGALVAEAEGGT